MFCPNCGNANQTENTYCRNCGEFLPDLSGKNKLAFGGNTPEEQIRVNLWLNLMSSLVSLALAVALYVSFWGQTGTPSIIYIVAGFLVAISGWQISTFFINLKLKKTFQKRKVIDDAAKTEQKNLSPAQTKEFLPEADFKNIVPDSVTEQTTRKLKIDKG